LCFVHLSPFFFAAEHAYTSKVTEKSDIYSFGVVLMELVTGKKAIVQQPGGSCMDIVRWTYNMLTAAEKKPSAADADESDLERNQQHKRILDPGLADCPCWHESMAKVLRIAMLCTSPLPLQRPSMREVIHMLKEADPGAPMQMLASKCI
jgi:serine/threonine protein kinase